MRELIRPVELLDRKYEGLSDVSMSSMGGIPIRVQFSVLVAENDGTLGAAMDVDDIVVAIPTNDEICPQIAISSLGVPNGDGNQAHAKV